MHDEALAPNHLAALLALKPAAALGFYLAGGTALCLRLAHRRSIDLDLFRDAPFDPELEPDPILLKPVEWRAVRDFFEREVRTILANR